MTKPLGLLKNAWQSCLALRCLLLANIFEENELQEIAVVSKMETTANDGKNYLTNFYNLDAIIS